MYLLNNIIGFGRSSAAVASSAAASSASVASASIASAIAFKRYNLRPDIPDFRDRYRATAVVNPAKSVDLRSGMPPVYDQGKCGSCTAQAIAAALEFDEMKQRSGSGGGSSSGADSASVFTPSRLFIYYNERAREGTVSSDSGSSLRDGIKTVARQGFCSEQEWPYDIEKFADQPPQSCYDSAAQHKAVEYNRVTQSLYQLQDALSSGFPVICGISVYESFESDDALRTGRIPYPDKSEQLLGGHGILLCGYNNAQRTFTFRNSWGTSFGDAGYGYIPFNYILNADLASDFWVVTRVSGGM